MDTERAEELLQNYCGVSDETLTICECGWGANMQTLETILFVVTGLRDFEQLTEYIEREW